MFHSSDIGDVHTLGKFQKNHKDLLLKSQYDHGLTVAGRKLFTFRLSTSCNYFNTELSKCQIV